MSSSKKAKLSNLTIIGSGLAGYTLVREIRKLDPHFPITLITADDGDYYSKPQLSTALTHHKTPEQLVIFPAQKFANQFNIKLITHTKLETLPDSPVALACGAKPINLFPNAYHINNLQDYHQFRQALETNKQVTIIGAGLVGCEFANDLINTGYDVTVIAPESYPLARLVPEEIGIELKKALEEKGVKWRLGELFNPVGARLALPLHLSAIGLKPVTFPGIKINKGIMVDDYLETNIPNVYALGDCMEFQGKLLPYVAPIAIGARALAKTILGEPTPVIFPPMPIYIKTSLYPIVTLQPEVLDGSWHLDKSLNNCRGLYYNQKKQLKGFSLGGRFTTEAMDWLKRI